MRWASIPNSGNRFISDTGLIKKDDKILKISHKNGGYGYVAFSGKKYYVHRLVATAFIQNPENHPQVNHIDGNRANACYSNLEWCSPSQNMLHSFRTGINISRKGEHVSCATLTDDEAIEIRLLAYLGASNRTLAQEFNYDISSVRKLIKRKIWSHV